MQYLQAAIEDKISTSKSCNSGTLSVPSATLMRSRKKTWITTWLNPMHQRGRRITLPVLVAKISTYSPAQKKGTWEIIQGFYKFVPKLRRRFRIRRNSSVTGRT